MVVNSEWHLVEDWEKMVNCCLSIVKKSKGPGMLMIAYYAVYVTPHLNVRNI